MQIQPVQTTLGMLWLGIVPPAFTLYAHFRTMFVGLFSPNVQPVVKTCEIFKTTSLCGVKTTVWAGNCREIVLHPVI